MAIQQGTLSRRTLKKFFTTVVIMIDILRRYASPIPYVDFAECLLFLFWIAALIDKRGRFTFLKCYAPLCLYLVFHIVLDLYSGKDAAGLFDTVGSTLRVLFYIVTLAVLSKPYFDFAYGVRLVRGVAVISTVYAMIQTASFKLFGVILKSYITFLPVYERIVEQQNMEKEYFLSGGEYRAFAFFGEPSALGTFLVLALAFELHLQRRHWMMYAALFWVGCFVCRSSTGIVLSIFLVARYYIISFRKMSRKRAIGHLLTLLTMMIAAVLFVAKSEIWAYFIYRTFHGEGVSLSGLLMNGRFRYWNILTDITGSPYTFLFGIGAAEAPSYLPGFARVLYYWGLIGLVLYIAVYWYFFLHFTKEPKRTLLLLYLPIEVIGGLLMGHVALYTHPFLLVTDTELARVLPRSGDRLRNGDRRKITGAAVPQVETKKGTSK